MTHRLARVLWWWTVRSIRRSPVRRVNHRIAAHLGKNGAAFLERGKRQNAWARRHAIQLIRWSLNVFFFTLLCLILYNACTWLFERGYFTAPGSPQRELRY